MHKKLFAVLMMVLLAFSFAGTAVFAEGETSQYLDPTQENTFNIPMRYRNERESGVSPKTTLYFQCVSKSFRTGPDDQNPLGENDMTFPAVTLENLTFEAGEATLEGAVRNAVVTIPAISRVGIYEYKYYVHADIVNLKTTSGDAEFTVRISVFNGTEPDSKQMAVGVVTPDGKIDELELWHESYEYSITKEVAGNLGDRDKEFNFTVKLTGEFGRSVHANGPYAFWEQTYPNVTISYSGGQSVSGSFQLEDVIETDVQETSDNNGPIYYYTYSFEKEITFSLKHGETVTFTNLIPEMSITLTEDDYSGEGYTTTIDGVETRTTDPYYIFSPWPMWGVDQSGEPIPDPDTGEILYDGGDGFVTVVNTKNGTIDTGISLDDLPYVIAISLVVIAGVAFLIAKKRESGEDRA